MSTTTELDMTALDTFVGQLITELGATVNAGLVFIGDQLGLYRAMAGAGGLTPAQLAERTEHQRAVRARVARRPGRWRIRDLRPRHRDVYAAARTGLHPGRRREPSSVCGRVPAGPVGPARRTAGRRALPDRRRPRLARTRPRPVRRDRAVLPPRLRRKPDQRLDSRARRRRGQAARRGAGRRRRLWPRRVDAPDGRGVSRVAIRRHRLSRGVDRNGQGARRQRLA